MMNVINFKFYYDLEEYRGYLDEDNRLLLQ